MIREPAFLNLGKVTEKVFLFTSVIIAKIAMLISVNVV
nr:MAG TPA: hypothetical protein [Caudoviricetes sp.]